MQSEAVKYMVRDMETVESLLGNKGRFVGDMVHISIKDLAQCIAAQSPASAAEVVTVAELTAIMSERLSDDYYDDAVFYSERFPNGVKVVAYKPLKSPEGV